MKCKWYNYVLTVQLNDILKSNNDTLKDTNKQLTTLLDKIAVNNENQIQQINSQCSEIAWLRTEVQRLEVSLLVS